MPALLKEKGRSLRAIEAANFFFADMQVGLGPFVAAYLASAGWRPDAVGRALTVAGLVTVLMQSPAGWAVDRVTRRRILLCGAVVVLGCGALLLATSTRSTTVYAAQAIIGGAGAFIAPTLAAITMGLVGVQIFDRQFGRNQGFNAAGNLFAAALIFLVSHYIGDRAIFYAVAMLSVPTLMCVFLIRHKDIDPELARGGCEREAEAGSSRAMLKQLAQDRILLAFIACGFLFHLANAAMLPQLGELLAKGAPHTAAPFMSACIAVTQLVMMLSAAYIGRRANTRGRRHLLLLSFSVLPIRAVLYTVLHSVPLLLAVQVLDGVANAIFGVVSILVIADRTKGSGRFNLAQGALATAVGLGAAMSNLLGGVLMARIGYRISFWTLGAIAVCALLLLLFTVPETKSSRTA